MLSSIKKLSGYRILAVDGKAGRVREAYFDDDQWVVRYLVVGTKEWRSGKNVLISPSAITSIDWETQTVAVNLTCKQVEHSPSSDTHQPVSRQQEVEFFPFATYWVWGAMPVVVPADPQIRAEMDERRRTDADRTGPDGHLRSSHAVLGYHIQASDDSIGHVADFLFDDETWAIRYLVADTRNWLAGKHVLVSPRWIRAVNGDQREFEVTLTRRQIEESPEYDADQLPTGNFANAPHGTHDSAHESPR